MADEIKPIGTADEMQKLKDAAAAPVVATETPVAATAATTDDTASTALTVKWGSTHEEFLAA